MNKITSTLDVNNKVNIPKSLRTVVGITKGDEIEWDLKHENGKFVAYLSVAKPEKKLRNMHHKKRTIH